MNNMIIYPRKNRVLKRDAFGRLANIFGMSGLIVCLFFFISCTDSEESYTAPTISLLSVTYEFDQFGGNGTIVAEETTSDISASCEQVWITNIAVNEQTITFTVAPNTSISSRVAEVFLKSGNNSLTVTIMQASAMFTNKDEYTINCEEGVRLIEMPTELEYSVTIDPADTWITSYQIVNEGLSITVEASPLITSRSTTVNLTSSAGRERKTFSITQQGYDFGIYPERIEFPFQGGTESIIISGSRSYTVDTGVSWLTYTQTSGGGTFTAESNAYGDERTATVVFTDDTYGATSTFVVYQAPDPAEYEDYLGDWEIAGYNAAVYIVTLSTKVEGESFNMTSVSWPDLAIECKWSTANNGRRLTIYCQQLATNSDGSILLCMPAYATTTGVSFNTGIGSSASYFKFDGVSTIICDGGTSSSYDGFVLYNRNATNTANVGWYKGSSIYGRFTGTVLTKIP